MLSNKLLTRVSVTKPIMAFNNNNNNKIFAMIVMSLSVLLTLLKVFRCHLMFSSSKQS